MEDAEIDAIYDYHDENGELLFQVVRTKNPKNFLQRANGKWGLNGTRRVLYRLPKLLEAAANEQTIFIAEGEKAVDALVKLGVVATCSPGGAGKWQEAYAQHFKDAAVIVLPDNDE